jgi:hypothetical protein
MKGRSFGATGGATCLGLSLILALGHSLLAQSPRAPLGEVAWREDLKFFVAHFGAPGVTIRYGIATRGQKDFEKLYPPVTFDAAVKALDADLGRLSDEEITLRLMRIVASGNVGHTKVNMPPNLGFFQRLPITIFWYADGPAVIGAAQEYSSAVGARLLKIGTMTPEEALAAVAPYISHENDIWLHLMAPGYLVTRAMVEHLGLLGPDRRVELTLQKPGDEPFKLAVALDDPRVVTLAMTDVLRVPTPLYRSQPGSYYWYRYLGDSQTFYIQYNRCQNDPKLPFADFVRAAMTEADAKAAAHMVRRVVVDLRLNGGGDSRVLAPLKKALASRAKSLGPLYVLIGGGTFSSALIAAIDLHDDLHATLVGSPTGEKPNSYGEVNTFTLPNSKLVVAFSTKYFRLAKEGDPPELDPGISASATFADALAGRDGALEAAIAAR